MVCNMQNLGKVLVITLIGLVLGAARAEARVEFDFRYDTLSVDASAVDTVAVVLLIRNIDHMPGPPFSFESQFRYAPTELYAIDVSFDGSVLGNWSNAAGIDSSSGTITTASAGVEPLSVESGVALSVIFELKNGLRLNTYWPNTTLEFVRMNDDTVYLNTANAVGDSPELPDNFRLKQNYPNPFNPTTTIGFSLARVSQVDLCIYNSLGRCVRKFALGELAPGDHSIEWDGTDNSGHSVSSGVYFYRLRGDVDSRARKMMLVK